MPSNHTQLKAVSRDNLFISFSQHSMLSQCPLKWYFKYIELVPEPQKDTKYLELGTLLHNVLERSLKFAKGKVISKEEAKRIVGASISRELEDYESENGNEEFVEVRLTKAIPKLSSLVEEYAPFVDSKGEGVEKYVEWVVPREWYDYEAFQGVVVPLYDDPDDPKKITDWVTPQDVVFRGFVDLFTKDGVVVDWKTGRPSGGAKILKYAKQIQTYSFILRSLGHDVRKGRVVFIEHGVSQEIDVSPRQASQTAREVITSVVNAHIDYAKTRNTPQAFPTQLCRFCGYSLKCALIRDQTFSKRIRLKALGGMI